MRFRCGTKLQNPTSKNSKKWKENVLRRIQETRQGAVINNELFVISNITPLKEVVTIRLDTFFNSTIKQNALTRDISS